MKTEIDAKKYKFVGEDTLPYNEFINVFEDKLQKYLRHSHTWHKQHIERTKACKDPSVLKNTSLFGSIDFIANKQLSLMIMPQGMNQNTAQISMLVIYETCNNGNVINDSAHVFISNQTSHGWYSVLPSLKTYYSRKKRQFSNNSVQLKTHIIFSDRGPGDLWCAPFIAYACELANDNDIRIYLNTTVAGHGKWMHDQLGATVSKFIRNAIRTGKIKFKPNESIAGKIVEYLNLHFRSSEDDTITRYFYELPVSEVKRHPSPVNTLEIGDEGISAYHSCII